MPSIVVDTLQSLRLGEPQVHENLTLLPLLADSEQPACYLTLAEALKKSLVRVTEVSTAGAVPASPRQSVAAQVPAARR